MMRTILFFMLLSVSWVVANEGVKKEDYVLLDVRSAEEFAEGYVEGALNIPHDQVAEVLPKIVSNKKRKVYVYCRSGGRSAKAKGFLKDKGYENIHDLGGYAEAKKYFLTK